MELLVIDGQGGGIGKQIVSAIKREFPHITIIAVGTNAIATSAMLSAGADRGATGENAVIVNSRRADVIVGPIGIVVADALMGEITPSMAVAIGQSRAKRILIPNNHCDSTVVGVSNLNTGLLIRDVVKHIGGFLDIES